MDGCKAVFENHVVLRQLVVAIHMLRPLTVRNDQLRAVLGELLAIAISNALDTVLLGSAHRALAVGFTFLVPRSMLTYLQQLVPPN